MELKSDFPIEKTLASFEAAPRAPFAKRNLWQDYIK